MVKILLFEDNDVNREMLTRRLQRRSYEVVCGTDGAEAVSRALNEQPDLILMDMSMPLVDGWQATQELKAHPQTQAIPVIALTAHAMAGDREKTLAVGCDEYATKPIDLEQLIHKIQALTPAPVADPVAPLEQPVEEMLLRYLRHELCTPINAIVGYSEILLDEISVADNADLRQDISKIHSAGLQLLESTRTILDPSQLESHPLMKDITSCGSRVRLELLTPLSTVIGYVEMLTEEIPDAHLPDVQRLDKAARQLLAMVNDIVNLAQQQLQVINNQMSIAQGLRLDTSTSPALTQTATRLLQSLKQSSPQQLVGQILIVDDNTTNCDLLSRQLERYGCTTTTANGGSQALQLLSQSAYDLVLLDLFMPDMNGLEVLSQIKQQPDWCSMPVIMISALAELDQVVSCIELGAEDYLTKPFNPTLLKAKIGACLEKKRLQDQQVMYLAQRLIAEATPVPILISRIENGQILYANKAAGETIGLPVAELLQRSAIEFYHNASDRQPLVEQLSRQIGIHRQEILCRRANGEPFWVAASMQPLMFDGESTILSVLYDISDRKKAEEALRITEESYRSIFENALAGIYQSTPDGQYLRVNAAMARIFGYESPAAMMECVTHIPEQVYVDAASQRQFQQLMYEHGSVSGFEYQAYTQTGDVIWVAENARVVMDDQGQILCYEGILENITDRKLAEVALKREVQELRIEIDQAKRVQAVAEITGSDYFKEIQAEAETLQLSFEEDGQPAIPHRATPKILIVEDNELNRDMLTRRLCKAGYDVEIAVNGQEGVAKTVETRPNIVLMDMSLPIMDGWAATRTLKADPNTQAIPVIALTAHAMATDREKALAAGCDEYDTKPIDWQRLLGKVEHFLKQPSTESV